MYYDMCFWVQVILSAAYFVATMLAIKHAGEPCEMRYLAAMMVFCALAALDFLLVIVPTFLY